MSKATWSSVSTLRARELLAAAAFVVMFAPGLAQADVKVRGATTVAYGLMNPHKARIEQLARANLTILPSSTGHGLADLASGNADIAMLADSLETAADAVNNKTPGLVNLETLASRHVGDALVQFIVHPSNPIVKISKDQLADLYSGKIRNWSELGGNDQPVMVVGEPTSSPYRMIRDALAISYRPDLRAVQNTNQTATIVVQAPGAIGNISTAHDVPERDRFKVLETGFKLPLRLYLAYRKDAREEVMRVIEAVKEIGKP
jgi:phosphate transport system substrate-binding protein